MPAYSSNEAAQMLSIAPVTLRKLSIVFAAWLSPSAASTMMIDVTWDRSYNDGDLDTLRYIITLLKQKRDYAWVRERLIAEFGGDDLLHSSNETGLEQPEQPTSQAAPDNAEAQVVEPEPDTPQAMPFADHADRFERNDTQPEDASYVIEVEVIEPESHVPPDVTAMLTRMADLYQDLLRTKEQEITALRQALDVTELSAANERRELETLNRLAKMMERENQRLTTELEEAQHQLGQGHARRGLLARLFGGGEEETGSASHSQV